MDPNSLIDDDAFWQQLSSCDNISNEYTFVLLSLAYQSDRQKKFSEPLPWIGMYIALASLFCISAIVADLVHGLRSRKLWFPCKYFTVNAASLTVISIAMKLPVDLNNQMPGFVDQAAKLGSLGFMCTIMANLLPSLATMDSKELVSNFIALGVVVITLVVNVCIQIYTGIFSLHIDAVASFGNINLESYAYEASHRLIETIYVGVLLMMVVIYACSSLAVLKSKQLLESKYQAAHETTFKDQELKQPSVEKLKQHVRNYWIMAETGSPQFMTACSATTTASGVICVFSTVLHIRILMTNIHNLRDYRSDYKWSMSLIFIIQFIGAILGTIAPVSRCFAALSFKLSVKWIWNHIKVFHVESYWTQKLSDWKHSSIPFPSIKRRCKIVIHNLKNLIVSICIGFQKTVVIACKIIGMIPIFLVISLLCCFRCWKWVQAKFSPSRVVLVQNPEQLGKDTDLSHYVLQLQDDMEFPERTLRRILKAVNHSIERAEKQTPNNLMKLLAKSTRGFEGVKKFDSHRVPPLLSKEHLNCWSLPLVTLTTIAISLPNIQNHLVDFLMSSVSEGLVYVNIVEESLNATNDHLSIQKAAKTLWLEVEVYRKWLGNRLPKPVSQPNSTRQLLQLLSTTAKHIATEFESVDTGDQNDNSKWTSISANSMYRITETIMLSCGTYIDTVSQEGLFAQLSSVIADILAACLTNLPRVISMKCHASAIEKRETSVHAAAQLLGETMQIINTHKDHEIPNMNPDELAHIDKWRAYFKYPFP